MENPPGILNRIPPEAYQTYGNVVEVSGDGVGGDEVKSMKPPGH